MSGPQADAKSSMNSIEHAGQDRLGLKIELPEQRIWEDTWAVYRERG